MGKDEMIHRGRKKAYLLDDSCALCGNGPVENGRIFRGHCVCEECVDYIVKMPKSSDLPEENDQEAAADNR